MNKKILIPLSIYLALIVYTLLSARDIFVDEAFSILIGSQYPVSYWFALSPSFFIISIFFFYKASKSAERDDQLFVVLQTLFAILALAVSLPNPKDAHPPLFPFIMHGLTLVSTNITFLRSISAIFGFFSIIALWHYCKTWHDEKVALLATTLFAISSTYLHYFSEIRQYALLILLGILATHQLRLIIQKEKSPWLYSLIIITMAYLHYFTAIFLIMHFVIMLIHKTKWNTIRTTYMPVFFACIPLVYYFLLQKARIVTMYLKPPTAITWLSSISFSLNYPDNLLGLITAPLLIPLTLLILALIIYYAVKKDDKWTWSEVILATTPQMLIILIACFYNIYSPRYNLNLLWLIPVLIAAAIGYLWRKK